MDRLWIVLAALAAVLLQTTLLPLIFPMHAAPDLVLLLVIFFALQRQTTLSLWVAFLAGLAQDVLSGSPLGLNAALLLCVGYGIGLLRGTLFKENLTAQVLIMVLLTWAYQFGIYYWLNRVLHADLPTSLWAGRTALMSLYHAVLGPLVIRLLQLFIPGEDVYAHIIASRLSDGRTRRVSAPR
jgi:rod shape-determining protein MreD